MNCSKIKSAAAVVLKLVSRQQKDSDLQTKKGHTKKSDDAYDSNCFVHMFYILYFICKDLSTKKGAVSGPFSSYNSTASPCGPALYKVSQYSQR